MINISPREMYRQHRQRMKNITSKVNTHLPPRKIKCESEHMHLSYMELMTAMHRKSNNTRTFTKSPERLAAGRMRNANVARQQEHKRSVQSINRVCSALLSEKEKSTPKNSNCTFSYEIPLHVLHRYETLMSQCEIRQLCKLLRPIIYLDLYVHNTTVRGRLVIQLFTEACPQVVLEFMRACTHRQSSLFTFARVVSPLLMEGKLQLNEADSGMKIDTIEHDMEVLHHGVSAGILSFPCRYVRGNQRDILSFSVSFKPLSAFNGKRVAFGKVRRGLRFLDRIRSLASKSHKAMVQVVTKRCGLL